MYDFLRQRIVRFDNLSELHSSNCRGDYFISVSNDEIQRAESGLASRFPEELRTFYYEIGYGFMGGGGEYHSPNRICHPTEIPQIIDLTYEGLTLPEFEVEPETLPFFERDVNLFLCLHPKSDNPNAVWWMWGDKLPNGGKICDSLVEFFQRLIEDPNWFNPQIK